MSINNKLCIICFTELTNDNIRQCDLKQSNYICKICRKFRDKQKYQNKKEIIRQQQKEYNLSIKKQVIENYGSKCLCCGETNLEFLMVNCEIENKLTGSKLYNWLIVNDFPKENYNIYCHNCSNSINYFGYCPHNSNNTAG